tara:strand:+ start:1081 stop:1422 length:342 start_codon:yes stop_codon:yes gene_type:complete
MKVKLKKKPRVFYPTNDVKIKNYGCIEFNNGDQIYLKIKNFYNEITRQNWGFYLTSSCNSTLRKRGFKTAIVKSKLGKKKKIFIKIVLKNKIREFNKYLKQNKLEVISWLDKK